MLSYEQIRGFYTRFPILFHLVGWGLYIFAPMLLISSPNTFSRGNFDKSIAQTLLILKLVNDVLLIGFFYLNFHKITPISLKKRSALPLILSVTMMIIVILILNSLFFNLFIKPHILALTEIPVPFRGRTLLPFPFTFSTILSLLFLMSVGTALVLFNERIKEKEEKQQAVIERTAAELAALKLQISPHFLFNTLNSLRWLARKKSEHTEESIIRLSEILRYMIYQTNEKKVSVAKEIEYINHYIELQKMRLSPNNQVVFKHQIDKPNTQIEPLMFLAFIENAFKYGIDNEAETLIQIDIILLNGKLNFNTKNLVFNQNNDEASGIGIKNIERRLDLNYPEKHDLRIYNNNKYFCVDLEINLA
jgi:sensor histidine kinase YesM